MSTRRRARNPRATAIVLGEPATAILHHNRTAHLLPVRSGDHRARYATGMRLAVKVMVPGPTACHIILTTVHGPRDQHTLGQITRTTAKDLGHIHLDAFWRHWITNHDQAWLGQHVHQGTDTDTAIAERFHHRWSGKLVWLLRFHVDIAAAPHLLAARSDELYVENAAMALRGELPALTEDEWKRHVKPWADERRADRIAAQHAQRAEQPLPTRVKLAQSTARIKGLPLDGEFRRLTYLLDKGRAAEASRQLGYIEARVFPQAA